MPHPCIASPGGISIGRLTILTITFSAIVATPALAVTAREVDDAVDKAVAYLLSQQKPDGSWEIPVNAAVGKTHAWGGETAICTYALLAAGQSVQTPAIKNAIEWLEAEDLHGTYAVALRSQVWNLIPERFRNPKVILRRERDKEYVLWARGLKGPGKGFYTYSFDPNPLIAHAGSGGGDRSNSQYGVLGAWALEQAGAEIPTSYWLEEDEAWKKDQNMDGGWAYGGHGGDSTATMTAAGLATLFVTQDYVMRANAHQFDKCVGGVTSVNIEKGLAWFDKHAEAALKTGAYGLYGIARVGEAGGRKYFGTIDWYKTGADALIGRQAANGSWGPLHDTCFSMLFLIRGRAPVMLNKLIYDTAIKKQTDPWNERPRDAANLARWMSRRSPDGFLNWQIVNLSAPVDELHDAPILYIAGSTELMLSNMDIDKLRVFVEQGGTILGNADCGSKTFAQSFEKLGAKMFPKYEFRKLLASHPIFDALFHAGKWKTHPVVEAMSNGIREMLILVPASDPAHAWQNQSTKIKEEAFQLAANIFVYTIGREDLRHKGDSYLVQPVGPVDPAARTILVARIQLGENWDPEPGGWRRLAAIMHNNRRVEIKADPVKLDQGLLAGYKIAHLTGTTKIILTAGQEQALKTFVDTGGTLIIDAAGGSIDFADSIEMELKKIWGVAAGLETPLPPDHLLFSTPDAAIDKIAYRAFARHTIVGHLHDPRIRAISVQNPSNPGGSRIGVFYSREDLSAGMVGQEVDGIIGYSPQTATQIMANMVMSAAAK